MNIASLNVLSFQFDIIGITETKFIKGIAPITDPKLTGYKHHHTATESSEGGALMYIRENLKLKGRGDLENLMYKPRELESVFYEVNPGKKGEVYGCIYKHPCLDIDVFNDRQEKLLKK